MVNCTIIKNHLASIKKVFISLKSYSKFLNSFLGIKHVKHFDHFSNGWKTLCLKKILTSNVFFFETFCININPTLIFFIILFFNSLKVIKNRLTYYSTCSFDLCTLFEVTQKTSFRRQVKKGLPYFDKEVTLFQSLMQGGGLTWNPGGLEL